ncbi:polymorphic toxin-type HINT domain-containing protein [Actinoplanes sp. NPDC051861]|uniref:polymorphic toxin-type HINT domain-containing protein n=1 Tax=Actinoplanes sp. NPDC051861 TaxID=3155170 RepID=UPI0034294606
MSGWVLTSGTYNAAKVLLSKSRSEYDATGLLVKERQPINGSDAIETKFGYDLEGNRTRFTDGRDVAFWTTYNTWGMPEAQIEPATAAHPDLADRTFTTSYDAGGRAVKQVQPGGVTITNTYDILGQLTKQAGTGAEAATVDRTFKYDNGGRIKEFSGVGGANTVTYDDRGLPMSIQGSSGSSSFTYNGDGAMTSRTDAAGKTDYSYDTAGRLSKLTNTSKGVDQSYTYDARSMLKKITYGTGNSRNYTYDDRYRPVADDLKTASGTSIAKIEYGWNANDDLTSKKTTGFGGAGTVTNTYSYDLADRLTSWNNGTATTVYAYDKAGNRLQNGGKLFTYDARNRLLTGDNTTYNYTARGSLRYAGTTETKTDAFGQVVSQGQTSGGGVQRYDYDALGRAVKTGFSYTGTGNDLAADGQATYIRGTASQVVAEANTGGTRYAWTDLHSDVVGQFTAAGTALDASTVYDPLGKVIGSAGAMIGSLGYQSEWTEPSTSRVNMAARWYNTDTGQFDTRDTYNANPAGNSVGANRYQYGDANPLTVTDPTGHWGIGSAWRAASKAVSSTYSRVSSTVSSYASSAYSYTRSYASYAYSSVKSTYNAAKNTVKTSYAKAKKAVKSTVRKAVKRVKQTASKVKRYASKAIKKVKEKTTKFAKAALNKAAKITKSAVKKAKQAGKAIASAAKRAVKNPVAAIKDAAKATATFVAKHKDAILEVAAVGLGIVAGLACTFVTAGAGALACMVGASALVNLAKDAAQGNISSFGDALGSLGTGALSGLVGGVGGAIAGKVGTLVAGKLGTGILGRLGTEAIENGVDEVINQAATTGRIDPKAAIMGMVPGLDALKGGGKKGGGASTSGGPSGGLKSAAGLIDLGISAGPSCPGEAAENKKPHSFEPDTQVLMADGTNRPIEDINIGDKVIATDPHTGKQTAQPVTQLHRNTDHELTDLTVKDQHGRSSVLNTTQNHPLWNETEQAWTEAKDLKPGDKLETADGSTLTVNTTRNYNDTKEMRDLTVANIHTYYVLAGNTPVLVHNTGGDLELCRVSDPDKGTSERVGGLDPNDFPDVDKNGDPATGAAHFGNSARTTDFAVNNPHRAGDGFKVRVPQQWIDDNDIEIWEGLEDSQLEYLIPRDLIPDFNRFGRTPWKPGEE